MGFFDKLKKINIFASFGSELTDDFYDELEESLILADTGMDVPLELVEALRRRVREERIKTMEEARSAMVQIIAEAVNTGGAALDLSTTPSVVLFIGVNGVGKTTTIGKIGHQLRKEGKKVLFCAADTFRAAAADQLETWGAKVGVPVVRSDKDGADPASVAFEASAKAKEENVDVLIIDTAGRLQNKANLMDELGKIRRVTEKNLPVDEVLLVLDATTGQNALSQAKLFKEAAGVDELILTKLDGTAKGGVAIAVAMQEKLPITYVGLGEKLEDLRPFNGADYARALLGDLDQGK